jgi:hypothetical protein
VLEARGLTTVFRMDAVEVPALREVDRELPRRQRKAHPEESSPLPTGTRRKPF